MARGTVLWFNHSKGYGFIKPDVGNGKDVFVHGSKVAEGDTLEEGDEVEFEVVDEKKGPSAANVRRI